MPLITLKPNTHVRLRYEIGRRRTFRFRVRAEYPVSTYVLDSEQLKDFEASEPIDRYGGFTQRLGHLQRVALPFEGTWYLVILNSSKTRHVAVYYEVSY